jgi:hypothetical protein
LRCVAAPCYLFYMTENASKGSAEMGERMGWFIKRRSGFRAAWFKNGEHVEALICLAECNENVPTDPAALYEIPSWPKDF